MEVEKILAAARKKLFDVRAKRIRPGLDDKVLTSWNGLMIGALAYAGTTIHEPRYVDAARKAAEFATSTLYKEGQLLHRYRDGEAGLDGLMEDYAFLTAGLLDLYEATLEEKWLKIARDLTKKSIELFYDEENGGFFTAQAGKKYLIARSKDSQDGALPSPSNVGILNLVRLSEITSNKDFRDKAGKSLESYAEAIQRSPLGFPVLIIAVDWLLGPSRQIVLVGDSGDMRRSVYDRFLPATVLVHAGADPELSPMTDGKKTLKGKPTAYVCIDYACKLPTSDLKEFEKQLSEGW